jgi:hypothetical protein
MPKKRRSHAVRRSRASKRARKRPAVRARRKPAPPPRVDVSARNPSLFGCPALPQQLTLALQAEGVSAGLEPAGPAPPDSIVIISMADKSAAVEILLKVLDDLHWTPGPEPDPIITLAE